MALDLNQTPYFDDFDEAKNYLRILFNPGRAVQARELTQAQTILQDQVSKFSKHIFSDGTPIIGAEIKVNLDKRYMNLDALDSGSGAVDVTNFLNKYIKGETSGATAYVTHIDAVNRRLYFDLSGGSFDENERIDTITSLSDQSLTGFDATISTAGLNFATMANSSAGLIYMGGYFVVVDEQEVFVDTETNTGTYNIGFTYTDTIVTSDDDNTLVDPANGSYNFNAPGADRYNVEAVLSSWEEGVDSEPADFYKILEIENKETLSSVDKVQYADILDILARRTHDESGNYSVRPHNLEVDFNETDDTLLDVKILPGKTYVLGYENETTSSRVLNVEKGRDFDTQNNESLYAVYGVYVDVALDGSSNPDITGLFEVNKREEVILRAAVDGTGSEITRTNIIAITKTSNSIRLWLQWKPSIGSALSSTKSISNVVGDVWANISTYSASNQPAERGTLVAMKKWNVKETALNEVNYTIVSHYTGRSKDGAGDWVILADDNFTNFLSSAQGGVIALVDSATGEYHTDYTYTTTDVSSGKSYITITPGAGMSAVTNIDVTAKLFRTQANPKTKTLTETTEEITTGVGETSIQLGHYDGYKLLSVRSKAVGDPVGNYVSVDIDTLTFDGGQTDVIYDYVTLSGLSENKDYEIVYYYFEHSGTGDYFSINSYIHATNLAEEPEMYRYMPSYKSDDGTVEYLQTNILDFRRTPTDLASGTKIVHPETNILVDYDYYLARVDKVYVSKDGSFGITRGIPAYRATQPNDKPDTMTMFILSIPSYTLEPDDVVVDEIEKKNFTMDDIRDLAKRIENLEYYVSLSLLEKDASEKNVLDELGNTKYKNGIMVDNFTNIEVGNPIDLEYRATIDKENGILRTPFTMENLDLECNTLDVDLITAGLKRNTNTYTLNYTTADWAKVSDATGYINVNPYDVFHWEGTVTLSPSSDNWVDTQYLPSIRNTSGSREEVEKRSALLNRNVQPTWGPWRESIIGRSTTSSGWGGRQTTTETIRRSRSGTSMSFRPVTTTRVSDRLVDTTTIYFMRSRVVTYTATGLLPNYEHAAYFDGIDVSANCTSLTTNNNGAVSGTFTIPAQKFRTGEPVEFKLIDANDPTATALSSAETTYTARGTLNTRQRTITSVNTVQRRSVPVSQSTTSRRTRVRWTDPIAQTFLVEETGGIFLDGVELFFRDKSSTVPVSVMVVENENGIPTQNIVPYSESSLEPASVTVSFDASAGTYFQFSDPVYLQDGVEYSFIVMSNSNQYNIFYAEIGERSISDSSKVVIKQPYAGVMLKSQNNSTWTPDQTKDVKFTLKKCVFATDSVREMEFDIDSSVMAEDVDTTLIVPNFEDMVLPNTALEYYYKFTGDVAYKSFFNKEDQILTSQRTIATDDSTTATVKLSFDTSNPNISPVINSERSSLVAVNNEIEDIVGEATYKDAGIYVSETVSLATPSDDIRVIVDAMLPSSSRLKAYYKTTSFIPKYVDVSDAVYTECVNSSVYVYWWDSATDGWTYKGSAYVTKVDSTNNRVYLSNITNFDAFIDSADFAVNGIDHVVIAAESGVDAIDIWDSTVAYVAGDYVFHNDIMYKALQSSTNVTPTTTGTTWELVKSSYATSVVTEDLEQKWKPMTLESTVDDEVDTTNEFVEYTYVPEEYADEEFSVFAVKLELQSTDAVNIPFVRNFRAIAVM